MFKPGDVVVVTDAYPIPVDGTKNENEWCSPGKVGQVTTVRSGKVDWPIEVDRDWLFDPSELRLATPEEEAAWRLVGDKKAG